MKRVWTLALVIGLVLALSLQTVAFAADETPEEEVAPEATTTYGRWHFMDEDGDGVCDFAGQGGATSAFGPMGRGMGRSWGMGRAWGMGPGMGFGRDLDETEAWNFEDDDEDGYGRMGPRMGGRMGSRMGGRFGGFGWNR